MGLALHDVALDAVVGQGAAPVGPAFRVTSVEGNAIRSLDGVDVGAALDPVLKDYDPAVGDLMVGISVPTRPAADGPAAADEAHPYVVRRLIGMHRESSALVVGAAPDLFAAEDVRIQLHAFGPQHARRELSEAAARLQGMWPRGSTRVTPCGAVRRQRGRAARSGCNVVRIWHEDRAFTAIAA